jgi:hypothetical protein
MWSVGWRVAFHGPDSRHEQSGHQGRCDQTAKKIQFENCPASPRHILGIGHLTFPLMSERPEGPRLLMSQRAVLSNLHSELRP